MMRKALPVALVIIAAAVTPAYARHAAASDYTRYALEGWTLTLQVDRFTGDRRCMLQGTNRTMLYEPGAVGFRVRSRDTLNAVYRVNDGVPVRWQDRYPTLIAAGVVVEGPGLDDPTARIVWVPEGELRGARTIRVRVDDKSWGQSFRLGAADRMIAAASRLGCRVVTSF